jgi:hypothetical protein
MQGINAVMHKILWTHIIHVGKNILQLIEGTTIGRLA